MADLSLGNNNSNDVARNFQVFGMISNFLLAFLLAFYTRLFNIYYRPAESEIDILNYSVLITFPKSHGMEKAVSLLEKAYLPGCIAKIVPIHALSVGSL